MSAAGRDRLCYELKPNVQWVVETKLTPWLVLLICALDVLWIWKNKPIQWLDIGFDSFRLPGLGLGDIERKAIYFNQGLLAQLLTIVGWMGAINKTYGLPPSPSRSSWHRTSQQKHCCQATTWRQTSWGGGWCALSNMIQHIFNLKACCTKIFIKKMQTPFHQRFFSSTFYDLKYYWLTVQNNSRSKITKTKQQKQSSCPQRFVFLLDFLKDIHCLSHGRVDHYERVFCELRITVVDAKMSLLFCFVLTKTDKITSRNAAKAFLAFLFYVYVYVIVSFQVILH